MSLSPSNPLRKPGYRFFIFLAMASSIGGGFHFIASYWIMYTATDSTAAVAWLSIAFFVPSLLVMPLAGVLVDRYNRRRIMAGLDAYFVLLNLLLIVLLASGKFKAYHLYYYGALASLAHVVFWNALMAYLQEVLEKDELLHANSLNTAIFQGGYVLGAGVAGLLYAHIGPIGAYAVDACAMLLCMLGWIWIKHWYPDKPRPRKKTSGQVQAVVREYIESLQYIKGNLPLFLFALFTVVPRVGAQLVNVLHVGFARDVLEAGTLGFGLMDLAWGLGAMAGGLLFPLFLAHFGVAKQLPLFAILLVALAALGISFSSRLPWAMLGLLIMGCATNVVGILANTTMQRDVSNEIMGRVLSSVQVVQYLTIPVVVWALGKYAELPKGPLIHADPLRDAFVLMAAFFAVLAVLTSLVSVLFYRHYEPIRHEDGESKK